MHCCCTGGEPAVPAATAPQSTGNWPRRGVAFFQWALPITALALVPMCPLCVAGYVLLFTGIGLSVPAAAAIRWALIVSCLAALLFLLARLAMGVAKHRRGALRPTGLGAAGRADVSRLSSADPFQRHAT